MIDPHAEYGIAASRKHLQRVKGSPGFAIDALDPSGRGVLLQFPAPVDQLPQPARCVSIATGNHTTTRPSARHRCESAR